MTTPSGADFLGGSHPVGATPLSPEDIDGLLPSWIGTREELNNAERDNIAGAVRWLFTGRKPVTTVDGVLDIAFCDRLHRRMFGDVWSWAGTHRRRETNIGVEPHRILTEMRNTLDDARYWHAHGTFPPAEIAVRLHHRLVSVHPYPNGNGRHTRMLADVSLFVRGEPRLTWGASTLVGDSDSRRRYIDAILAANDHDIVPLLEFARS